MRSPWSSRPRPRDLAEPPFPARRPRSECCTSVSATLLAPEGHKPWDLRPQTARGTVPAGRSGRLYRPGRTKHSPGARVHFLTRVQAVSPSSHPPAEGGGRKAGALSLWFRALLLKRGTVLC